MKSKQETFKLILGLVVVLLVGFAGGKWLFRPPQEHIAGPRYLIVNADDFGLSDGVTEGIIRAWRDGLVTSTSAMINIEGAPERVAAAHVAFPDLPIGLHLNITTGRPVLPPEKLPTLVDENGQFYTDESIIEHLADISADELRAELHAQAELLVASGVQFDHIDYHQHMLALYTPFYPLVLELAQEYDVPVRNPVPESVYRQVKLESGSGSAAAMQEMMKLGIQHPILTLRLMPLMTPAAFKEQAAALDAEAIGTSNWFVDAFYGNASVDNFVSILRQLPPGVSEMMVHPALVDDQLLTLADDYGEERADELTVLLDPRVKQALDTYQVTLVDFSFVQAKEVKP